MHNFICIKNFTSKLKSIEKECFPCRPRRIDKCKTLCITNLTPRYDCRYEKLTKKYRLSQSASDLNSYPNKKKHAKKEHKKKRTKASSKLIRIFPESELSKNVL